MQFLLILFLLQDPPPLPTPRDDIEPPAIKADKPSSYELFQKEMEDSEKQTLYIVYDDERNSKILLRCLKLDLDKCGLGEYKERLEALPLKDIIYVKWDDRDGLEKYRLQRDVDLFPAYRVGNIGEIQSFPERAFNTNFWPIDAVEVVVTQYFWKTIKAEYDDKLQRYYKQYYSACEQIVADISQKRYKNNEYYMRDGGWRDYPWGQTIDHMDMEKFLGENPDTKWPEWDAPIAPVNKFPWQTTTLE